MNRPFGSYKERESMSKHITTGLVIAALLLQAGAALAGSEGRLGTGGQSELRIPVGARSIGIAGSNVGSIQGAEAVFYNPAGLASSERQTELLFSYARYIADMDLNYLAIAQNMGALGWVGFSAKVLSVGEMIFTTESAPEGTGETFSPTFSTLGLTYAKALTDRVNFGGTLYYTSERILEANAGGVAFDFGFQYDTGMQGIRLGAAMKNYGSTLQFGGGDFERQIRLGEDDPNADTRTLAFGSSEYELPSYFSGGFSWPAVRGLNNFTVHGLYQSNSFGVDEARVGAELGLRRDATLRVGYKVTSNDDDLFGLTYGVGLRVPLASTDLFVDYGGQQVSDFFDDVHHVSIRFDF
jgi:hypothetical protein